MINSYKQKYIRKFCLMCVPTPKEIEQLEKFSDFACPMLSTTIANLSNNNFDIMLRGCRKGIATVYWDKRLSKNV